MKTIINKLLIAPVLLLGLCSCEDDMDYSNSGVRPVTELLTPASNAALTLVAPDNEGKETYENFSWERVSGAGAVTYQLVFVNAGGDEIYRIVPDNNASVDNIDVAHSTLNLIASRSGIGTQETGTIRWTVYTVKGEAEVAARVDPRSLTVTRYESYDDIPTNVYITGEATETGSSPSNAIPFKDNHDGTFELYTRLTSGASYSLINRNSAADGRSFYINDEGALLEGATTMRVENDAVHRIFLDFNKGTGSVQEMGPMYYFYPVAGTKVEMDYKGRGVWELTNYTLPSNLKTGDNINKYKFIADVGGTTRSFGTKDSDGASGEPSILEGDYFNVYYNTYMASAQYEFTFRMMHIFRDQEVTITLNMSSEVNDYYHEIDPGEYSVVPVNTLVAPADDDLLEIDIQLGDPIEFEWDIPAGTNNEPIPSYTVMFYKDEAQTELLGSVSADDGGEDNIASIAHTILNEFIEAAREEGADPEDVVSMYWNVSTSILDKTEPASNAPFKINFKPIVIFPSQVFLTGSGTEFGTNRNSAQELKDLGGNRYEIYTKLESTGTYAFLDARSNESHSFVVRAGNTLALDTSFPTAPDGIFRITVDFNDYTIRFENITRIELYRSWVKDTYAFSYTGNGTWRVSDVDLDFRSVSDDRYLIRFFIDGTYAEKWGSVNSDNPQAPNGSTAASFWYVVRHTGSTLESEWDYSWKWISGMNNGVRNLTVDLFAGPDVANIYHRVTYNN